MSACQRVIRSRGKSTTNGAGTTTQAILFHPAILVRGQVHEEDTILGEELAAHHARD